MRRMLDSIILGSLALACSALGSVPAAQADTFGFGITYQGELANGGTPVDGTADFVFRLFDASVGGNQVGPDLQQDDVAISEGIFKVVLDFTADGTIPGVYDGNERWLEITVNGTLLSPRQEFTPAPHAAVAWMLQFPFAARTVANPALVLQQDVSVPQSRALHVSSTSVDTGSVAIIGEMLTETPGNGTGVLGISRAGNGFGVIGTNLSPTGNCTGVYGNAESVNGIGVLGWSNHPSGATRGVNGKVESPNGHAGYFEGRSYFGGAVGIGLEDPQALLHISGPPSPSGLALNAYDNLFVGSGNDFVAVNRFTPITAAEFFGVRAPVSGTNYGGMYIETESGTGRPFYGYAVDGVARAWSYFDGANDEWRLHANGDRLVVPRLSGNLGVKRTPLVNDLEVEGTASKTTAGSWLANSDLRIKSDVRTLESALESLDKVRLVSFRYTPEYIAAHPEIEDRTYVNVVAQEFREVFPEDVQGSGERLAGGEEILQVDTYPLTIYSARAIQELHDIVRAQEERIARLETALAGIGTSQVPVATAGWQKGN